MRHVRTLVDQEVRLPGVANQVLRRASIPRNDDTPAGAVEAKAERRLHRLVLHEEGGDTQAVPPEDQALLELRHPHARRLALVHVRASNLDVPGPEREEPVHVGGRARRAEHLERRVLADDPPRQHEVAEVDHVVGVQMGEEDALELARPDPGAEQLHGHPGSGVHEERLVAGANERRRPATRRVRRRASGPEQRDVHRRPLHGHPYHEA
jgi:hypothetical protein